MEGHCHNAAKILLQCLHLLSSITLTAHSSMSKAGLSLAESYMTDNSLCPVPQRDVRGEGWVLFQAMVQQGTQGSGCPGCPQLMPGKGHPPACETNSAQGLMPKKRRCWWFRKPRLCQLNR